MPFLAADSFAAFDRPPVPRPSAPAAAMRQQPPSRLAEPGLPVDFDDADGDQQMKITLIQMLNSPVIKKDPDTRLWIQNRLMDAELRLRQRRKRRLST
ncbi:hypothetical protein KEM52_005714, partial [Ascosphaera acerosa]